MRSFTRAALAGLALSLAGCPEPTLPAPPPAATSTPATTPAPTRAPTRKEPFSEAELHTLWEATLKVLLTTEPGSLDRKLDVGRLAERAADRGDLSPELLEALQAALAKKPPSLEGLIRNLPQGGQIRLLRCVPGAPARIRLRRSWEGGFDYIDLLVEPFEGDYRVVDLDLWKSEALSLNISATLARGASQGQDQLALIHDARLQASAGEHARALQTLAGLPPATASLPSIWTQRLTSYEALGHDQLEKALVEFAAARPDSSARLLWLIGHQLAHKEYAPALKQIEALDARVGGDPHLWVLRASCQQGLGDSSAAKQSLGKATELLPDDVDVHFEQIDFALATKDWPLVAQTMTRCQERFGIEWPEDLATAPDYESFREFAKSAEYAAWKQR